MRIVTQSSMILNSIWFASSVVQERIRDWTPYMTPAPVWRHGLKDTEVNHLNERDSQN